MLLKISELSISFRTVYGNLDILDHISLQVGKGEIVGIVGESGSGKSVTALAILQILDRNAQFKEGTILFQDQNLLQLKEKEIQNIRGKKIAMIFQEPMAALNPTMKIGKQLAYVIRKHHPVSRQEANQLAIEALKDVKIKDPDLVFHQYPFQLSGGMCQRVVIALAMSSSPDLLIADEPTTALDVTVQAEILKLMQELCQSRGTSILLITHDLGVVSQICDRVYVMFGGRIVEEGKTTEVLYQSQHPYTLGLIESLPEGKKKREELKVFSGEPFNPKHRSNGCIFYQRCSIRQERCDHSPPPRSKSKSHRISCWEVDEQ